MNFPSFGNVGSGGGVGGDYTNNQVPFTWDKSQLWLEITNVADGVSCLNLHHSSNQVYAIWTTTNLLVPWQVETVLRPSDPDCHSFSLPNHARQPLFVRAEDWSTKDSDGDGIPDWWTWQYFGSPTLADTNLDYATNGYGYGHTFGYDYSNNITPTVFRYTGIHATNNYVGTSQSAGLLDVAGTPYYLAVSVDDTNYFSNATWQVYSSPNVPVNLGTGEGWHDVWIGLRGHADTADQAVWQHLWLKLDTTPPVLVITNPMMAGGAAIVDIPLIQIQGYSPEALSGMSYDLTNAAGAVSNQPVLILNQYYDPNSAEYTTNTFQAFDVVLTNGLNAVTFHATDLAGNMATVNYNVTVDYSAKTNPPNVQLIWPTNGMSMAGDSVTVRGLVDDATVKVLASVTDTNGATNTVSGVVERNGRFWLDNVPLAAGTNVIALTATDAAGNVTASQLILQRSSITVTINPPVITNAAQTTVSVSGTVSDPTAVVWVNGVQGVNHGDGTWSAANVPITKGGVATFDVTAYPAAEAPDSGSGGGGTNPSPTPGSGNTGTQTDIPPSVYLYGDTQTTADKNSGTSWDWEGGTGESESETHHTQWWIAGWGGAGGESSHSDSKSYQDGELTDHHVSNMNGSYALDGYGDGTETGTTVTDGDSSPFRKEVWLGWTWRMGTWWVGNEHCSVVDTKNQSWEEGGAPCGGGNDPIFGGGTSHSSYLRSAQTTYHVQTGGRAVPMRQNLWRFYGGASMITNKYALPPFWYEPMQAIKPTLVQIRGQHLDTNGIVYLVLPDGQDLDVTPQVPGVEFYTFGVGGQKYNLTILASSSTTNADLSTNTPEFCVGQTVSFVPSWSPETPPFTNATYYWHLPSKFVNEPYAYSTYCNSYRLNKDLLTNRTTSVWYVNGSGGDCSVGMSLQFANGQTLPIAAAGSFTVYRPTVNKPDPNGPFHAALTGSLITPMLQLASNAMYFNVTINSKYAGSFGLTQLFKMNSQTIVTALPFFGTGYTTWGNFNLDIHVDGSGVGEFYDGPKDISQSCKIEDAPGQSLMTVGGSYNGHAQDYVRFIPKDGIPVTLGRIDWNWAATADWYPLGGGWVISSDGVDGPAPYPDDNFPLWTSQGLFKIYIY